MHRIDSLYFQGYVGCRSRRLQMRPVSTATTELRHLTIYTWHLAITYSCQFNNFWLFCLIRNLSEWQIIAKVNFVANICSNLGFINSVWTWKLNHLKERKKTNSEQRPHSVSSVRQKPEVNSAISILSPSWMVCICLRSQ